MDAEQYKLFAARLNGARSNAANVDTALAALEGVWTPQPNKCHENCSTWAANNEGWTAIRGWVVFDLSDSFLMLQPKIHFIAHSVVRDPAGKLWEITSSELAGRYPFFAHPGTDDEFQEIVETHKLASIDFFPGKE